MIVQLTGKLIDKQEDFIVLDCNGIGYQLFIPTSVYNQAPELNKEFTVFTYHHIREDQQLLFGFISQQQKKLFNLLTSVSGVGPKVAIKILSGYTTDQLIAAILESNLNVLTSISGVGKKMAERLLIECKDKVPKLFDSLPIVQSTDTAFSISSTSAIPNDVLMALKSLGYSKDEIK